MSHTHACTHARMHAPKKCHHMQEHVHNYKCAYTGTHAYEQICTMKMPYCLETEFLRSYRTRKENTLICHYVWKEEHIMHSIHIFQYYKYYKAASWSKILVIDLGLYVHVDKFTKRDKFSSVSIVLKQFFKDASNSPM